MLVAATIAGFTSCSDDNDEPKLFELPEEMKTMTPASGLTMISNGQSLSDVTLLYTLHPTARPPHSLSRAAMRK